MVRSRLARRTAAALSLRRRCLLVGTIVAAVVAAGAPLRATYGARTTADEPHYLLTAISLWEDRDLDVSDERGEGRYLAFHEVLLPIQAEVQGDGTQVAPHDPLLPAILAPAVGLGGWLGAKLSMAALAGVLAALTTAVAVRRFAVGERLAAVVATLAGISPPLAIYGTQIYPELPAALATLAGLWWVTASPDPDGGGDPAPARHTVGAVAMVVALPWLSVKYAPVASVLAAGVAWRLWTHRQLRALGWCAGALAVAAGGYLAAHRSLYGGWTSYASGSHFSGGELSVVGNPSYRGRARRLIGLLVDRHFGLAVWQPALVAMVPALALIARRRPPGAVLLLAMVAAGWLNATFVALTMHGWWWPGRQTVVIVPLVVVAIAWWLQRASAPARGVVLALAVAGVLAYGALVAGVLAGRHRLIVDFQRTIDPLVRWVRPVLPDGRLPLAGATAWLTVAWVATLAGATLIALCHDKRRLRSFVVTQSRGPGRAHAAESAADPGPR